MILENSRDPFLPLPHEKKAMYFELMINDSLSTS